MANRRQEDDIVRGQIIPFYASLGFDVYATSARVHAKGVTPGIADLYVISSRHPFAFWHEAKRPTTQSGWKRQSHAQRRFQDRVSLHTAYVLGDLESAYDFAQWIGMGVRLRNGFHRDAPGVTDGLPVAAASSTWNATSHAARHQTTWGYRP